NMSTDVQIPQAPDAELAVLGTLMLDGRVPESVRERLKPAQFFVTSNRKIYEAELALDARGTRLDPVQVTEELRKLGALDEIGNYIDIDALMLRAVRSELDGAVNQVIEAAEKRKLWAVATRAAKAANNGRTAAEVAEMLRTAIDAVDESLNSLNSLNSQI